MGAQLRHNHDRYMYITAPNFYHSTRSTTALREIVTTGYHIVIEKEGLCARRLVAGRNSLTVSQKY